MGHENGSPTNYCLLGPFSGLNRMFLVFLKNDINWNVYRRESNITCEKFILENRLTTNKMILGLSIFVGCFIIPIVSNQPMVIRNCMESGCSGSQVPASYCKLFIWKRIFFSICHIKFSISLRGIPGSTTYSSVPSNLVVGSQSTWDDNTNSLYYVDLFGGAFCRYSVDDDAVYKTTIGAGYAGFITPIEGQQNRFLVALDEKVIVMKWDGVSRTASKEKTLLTIRPKLHLNSITVGVNNDIFIGGFTDAVCQNPTNMSLYRYTQNNGLAEVADGFVAVVGLAFNYRANILYQMDACTHIITAYNYNPLSGALCKWNGPKEMLNLH